VLIASESDAAMADAIIQALKDLVVPPGWSVHVDAFGARRFTRGVCVALPEHWTCRAYRHDPLGAIGKGWHPGSGSATVLGSEHPSMCSLADLLGRMGVPCAAPRSLPSVEGDGNFSFFDAHRHVTIIEAVATAIASAQRTDTSVGTTYLDQSARLLRDDLEALLAGTPAPRRGVRTP